MSSRHKYMVGDLLELECTEPEGWTVLIRTTGISESNHPYYRVIDLVVGHEYSIWATDIEDRKAEVIG